MVLLLRAVARTVALTLLAGLAALGLAVAVFSIQGDSRELSLPSLARHFQLPELREVVGDYLARLEADGPTAWVSVAAGAAAIAAGILLLVGALLPRRERLLVLERDEAGGLLAARRRALSQAVGTLAEQQRGVTQTKVSIRRSRLGRGRLSLTAFHSRGRSPEEIRERVVAAVAPVAEEFGLRNRVRTRRGERGKARVE